MLKKKITIILSVAVALNTLSGPIGVLAAELQNKQSVESSVGDGVKAERSKIARTSKFNYYGNESYNELFKMDNSNIKSISNNGGRWASQKIEYAIDGNISTYWETGRYNGGTFINEVQIDFYESETIDRLVYGARPSDNKGFAEEFEIYYSNSSMGEDFEILTTGSHARTGGLIEVKFEPTEMKRVKFKYIKSNQNSATANEFVFYKEDKLSNEINNMFVDGLEMGLKDDYDISKIESLENDIINHPLKDELQVRLNEAKKIISGEVEYDGTYWTLERRGSSYAESVKRKIWNFQDWQPTGYRAVPGDVINVYVDVADGEPLPSLVFKQMEANSNGTIGIVLHKGKNTITIPEFTGAKNPEVTPGGVLYTLNPYTETEQSREPRIRFENAKEYPHYVKGVDNDEDVLRDLEKYVEEVKNDPTIPNAFEVFSNKTLVTVSATEALKFYNDNKKTPSYTADAQDYIIEETMKFWGFDNSADIHSDFNFRYVTMVKPNTFLNAANGVTGMGLYMQAGALNGETSWGYMHEVGHNFDTRNRLVVESTNNIVPLQFHRLAKTPSKLTWEGTYENYIFPRVIKDDYKNNEIPHGGNQLIAPIWQLALYDDSYYPKLEQKFRESSKHYGSVVEIYNAWATFSSDIFKLDMSEHFERHGAKLTAETKEYNSKYKKSEVKTWYQNDSMFLAEGGAFTNDLAYSIEDVNYSVDEVKLSLKIDEENKKNRLGYEIYRDDKLIGFTNEDQFIDKNPEENVNHEYKIVAFDKTISPKDSASIKAFTPKLKVQDKIILAIGEEYNPANFVKATNYKGEDISSKLEFTDNININEKGQYNIDYKVTDNDITINTKAAVEVVSKYDYASDIQWKSATSGWKTVNKDSAVSTTNKIKLNVDGTITEFNKGIGAAANAEIVYDLEGKDYEYFTSYVGTDKNFEDNRTSIQFKVLADGKEVYTSSIMNKSSKAEYINIPIDGVKELKLIADNVDGNGIGDFTSWGDARFIDVNSKPELEIPKSEAIKLGVEVENIIGKFKATDIEDGDISSKVVVENNVNFNKTGVYDVKYTVTDSDGNTTSKKREIKVVDMNDSHYLSDIDWKSAVQSYGTTNKDYAVSGKALRLTGENGQEVSYKKGIGTHATSTIIYDLTNTNYGYFTSYVGVDREMYGRVGSVTFKVYLDNEMVYDSGLMNSRDTQKFIEVDLKGAKELKLVVTDGGNGNGSDHATFGDAKLHYANNEGIEVNKSELQSLLDEVKDIELDESNKEAYDKLMLVNSKVIESLKDGYNQEEINNLTKELRDALGKLTNYNELQIEVEKATVLKEYLYTKESWTSFKTPYDKAKKMLEDKTSTKKEVSEMITNLSRKIEELKIVKGTGSLGKGKDELEILVEKANRIKDISEAGVVQNKELLWDDFLENRYYAEEVLYEITEEANATEVTSVYLFLEQSIGRLQIKYYDLEKAVNQSRDLKEYLYTKDSWKNFKASFGKAEKMLEDKVSSKEEFAEMTKELNSKILALEIVKGTSSISKGKDELEKLVEQANKIKDISQIGVIENRELLWNDFLENRQYAEEVLYEISDDSSSVTSMYIFLENSMKKLQIKN